jgi:hypothetical protein
MIDRANYRATFPYEKEVRLAQFLTWIYFPELSMEMVQMSGRLAALGFLELREKELGSTALKHLSKDTSYLKLFDATIGEYGGLGTMVRALQRRDYHRELEGRRSASETVVQMTDYRFRYLDHGGTVPRQANISHSEFYCWEKGLSWKTVRKRWSLNKETAIYLYVNKYHPLIPNSGLISNSLGLIQSADDHNHIRRFFGHCAYVNHVLRANIQIPEGIEHLRLRTEPLPDSDLEIMSLYKARWELMKHS